MFEDGDAGRYLFHYTRSDTFMTHILPTMRLRMSSFKNLNDPRESKTSQCSVAIEPGTAGIWDTGAIAKSFTQQMKGSAFALCFTRDDPNLSPDRTAHLYGRGYAHPSMWDRYAGGHSGVCLMFDVDTLGDDVTRAVADQGELLHQGINYDWLANALSRESVEGNSHIPSIWRRSLHAAHVGVPTLALNCPPFDGKNHSIRLYADW